MHGVLWRLSTRDVAAINAYESVESGLYLRRSCRSGAAVAPGARAGLHCAPAREGDPAPGLYRPGGRGGARVEIAGAYIRSLRAGRHRAGAAREHETPGSWDETVIRHVMIRGRVQGVGYRDWVEYAALDHGLEGWVRNRRDGSVEAVFAGPAEAVDAMV